MNRIFWRLCLQEGDEGRRGGAGCGRGQGAGGCKVRVVRRTARLVVSSSAGRHGGMLRQQRRQRQRQRQQRQKQQQEQQEQQRQ